MQTFSKINSGTYAAIDYSEDTKHRIAELQKMLNLPSPVPIDKLHTTICYSRKWVPYTVVNDKNFVVGKAKHLEVFKSDEKSALVLIIDSDWCKERHEYAKIIGATYDFPDYKPHITLSYDVGNLDFKSYDLIDFPDLVANSEYVEDLDLDWVENNS